MSVGSKRAENLTARAEEMPKITASAYNTVTMTGDQAMNVGNVAIPTTIYDFGEYGGAVSIVPHPVDEAIQWKDKLEFIKKEIEQGIFATKFNVRKESNMSEDNDARRMVKVIIVDPDENVPLDKCVLYSGEEQITDLTNQELFFDIDMKQLLSVHNNVRGKIINKDESTKDEKVFLEPAKIRDLSMSVVTIATF